MDYREYLNKHPFKIYDIQKPPSGLLRYIVVIPSFCEPNIYTTLNSLVRCGMPTHHIEVFIVTNFSENEISEVKKENIAQHGQLLEWARNNSSEIIKFYPFLAEDLPHKHAGAGLARKIGMDSAVNRFKKAEIDNGVIVSLDADCTVHKNYFKNLEHTYNKNPDIAGCILNFTHIKSTVESENTAAVKLYELHLRYYKHALIGAGYPYHHYTLGSCFSVKAEKYCKYGGMNKRKAGEDFYFLQKIFPNESFSFIPQITVYPSARISGRVPFGTGPVIRDIVENHQYFTYPQNCFNQLNKLLQILYSFYPYFSADVIDSHPLTTKQITAFLKQKNYEKKVMEVINNTASVQAYKKRILQWFNGLMVIQFFNYLSHNFYPKISVTKAVQQFLNTKEDNVDLLNNMLLQKDFELY